MNDNDVGGGGTAAADQPLLTPPDAEAPELVLKRFLTYHTEIG